MRTAPRGNPGALRLTVVRPPAMTATAPALPGDGRSPGIEVVTVAVDRAALLVIAARPR